jgi:molecular chaperone GrpE (heat shock protein)
VNVTAGGEPELDDSDISGQSIQLERVLKTLATLQGSFDAKIRYDEAKERQIAALHQELETHRQGLYQQILRPVLTDLIGIYDEIANHLAAGENGDPVGGAGSLLEMVEGVLERYSVISYRCEGDDIDRARQRVIDVESTDDAELNRRLARRLRPGFELDGKILRPEWVIAYRHAPDTAAQPQD